MSQCFTVGDLKMHLQAFGDDDELTFGGGVVSFYRTKSRGDNHVDIEFNEPQGYLSDDFKKKNPNVKVVFIRTDDAEWDETGIVGGPLDVSVR